MQPNAFVRISILFIKLLTLCCFVLLFSLFFLNNFVVVCCRCCLVVVVVCVKWFVCVCVCVCVYARACVFCSFFCTTTVMQLNVFVHTYM